jgi:hypothetical protein
MYRAIPMPIFVTLAVLALLFAGVGHSKAGTITPGYDRLTTPSQNATISGIMHSGGRPL